MHTGEDIFRSCFFWKFVSCFDSDKVKKLEVYFGLYESSLFLQRRDDQINTIYEN